MATVKKVSAVKKRNVNKRKVEKGCAHIQDRKSVV